MVSQLIQPPSEVGAGLSTLCLLGVGYFSVDGVRVGNPGGIVVDCWLAKISASWCRASRHVSLTGVRGDAGARCRRAAVRSWAAAIARSADDAVGITRVDGN